MPRMGTIAYRNPDGTFQPAKHFYRSDEPDAKLETSFPEEDPPDLIKLLAQVFEPYFKEAVEAGELQ